MSGERDKRFEQGLLAAAEAANGPGSLFRLHVEARLELGENIYGSGWGDVFAHVLAELADQAAHAGAWTMLAVRRLAAEGLDGDAQAEILAALNVLPAANAAQYAAL